MDDGLVQLVLGSSLADRLSPDYNIQVVCKVQAASRPSTDKKVRVMVVEGVTHDDLQKSVEERR